MSRQKPAENLATSLSLSEATREGFKIDHDFIIAILLWVDDVVTCTEGIEEQEEILKKIHTFATKHKLKWGQEKCKIMRVGNHKDQGHNTDIPQKEWKIGDMTIQESSTYKYLGDIIRNDGKNTKNIEARKEKINASTITINTIAEGEILNKIETVVLLELHEKVNIPSLLTNCESWNLLKGEKDELERIEIQTLKYLFDLPIHTPTPAILYTFGTLFTCLRIEQRQLIYIHKILNKENGHWTKRMLEKLAVMNIGWYKCIIELLKKYDLPTDFQEIRNTRQNEWKRKVKIEIEKKNKERLKGECHKQEGGTTKIKTKTATILDKITKQEYSKYRRIIKRIDQ